MVSLCVCLGRLGIPGKARKLTALPSHCTPGSWRWRTKTPSMCSSSRREARPRAAVSKGAPSTGTVPTVSSSLRLLLNSERETVPITKESGESQGRSPKLLPSLLTFGEGNSELSAGGARGWNWAGRTGLCWGEMCSEGFGACFCFHFCPFPPSVLPPDLWSECPLVV